MNIHLFFHQDFDGLCSAAVFNRYIRALVPVTETKLVPVDYHLKKRWADENLPIPAAIVDFLFHPDAAWWFDHHETTFVRRDWQLGFVADRQHIWNTNYKSCPQLIIDSIIDSDVRKTLAAHFREYAQWCDVIDSAGYQSSAQVIESLEPALQINLTLTQDRTADYLEFLVNSFETLSLDAVAGLTEVQLRLEKARSWQSSALSYTKQVADVRDGVALLDLTRKEGCFHRYAAYYLWPKLAFQVAVYKDAEHFKLTIGANPWADPHGPDLSSICERYGGGGHSRIAGITVKDRKRALKIGSEIAKILRGKEPYHQQLVLKPASLL